MSNKHDPCYMYGWWSDTIAKKFPDSISKALNANGNEVEYVILTSFSGPIEAVIRSLAIMYNYVCDDLIGLGELELIDPHKKQNLNIRMVEIDPEMDRAIKDEENERGF